MVIFSLEPNLFYLLLIKKRTLHKKESSAHSIQSYGLKMIDYLS